MVNFSIAVSSLRAAFDRQDVTANNIANALTPAFQPRRAHQSELAAGGAAVDSVTRSGTGGAPEPTGRPLDLAVAGQGYLAVDTPRGTRYTRLGAFGVDGSGRVVDSAGNRLMTGFAVPENAVAVEVSRSGELTATMADGSRNTLGRIPLYRFANPDGLEAVGGGLFSPGAASGLAVAGEAGTGSFGEIIGGFLEGSGVELSREITDEIATRAALRAGIASLRTQDQMLGELLDLRG
ncbi:MAG TPA: flagellar hook basal-body protein [Planctomycetota bacterium]|nr:flagellar hook basal-body protein [Planctomycetota bacterium]